MHEELFDVLQEAVLNGTADKIARAAPRGGAKTTIVSLALPLWVGCYQHKNYAIIISDSSDQANDFLRNVREEFEDNEKIIEDFGMLEGVVWTDSNIILANGVRMQSLGAGKKVRGRKYRQHRPDLIIVDDEENDENIASPEQRKKNALWYFRAVAKAGDKTTDIIFIGTVLHFDSLLSKVLKNPVYNSKKYRSVYAWSKSPLWNDWTGIITKLENPNRLVEAQNYFKEHEAEMMDGTLVLWPQNESYYDLMVQFVSDGPAAFSSEKQNEPLSDDERRFLPEWIRYYEDSELVGKSLIIMGAVDPSLGKAGGDYSAIIIIGMDSHGIIYILLADIQKRHPDVIINDTISHYKTHRPQTLGVEDNQFQEYFKDSLVKRLSESEADSHLGMDVRGIHSHSDKILRIQSLQPDIKNGRVRFRRDQQMLIEQLVNFPSADHDDGPDALELAISLLGRKSAFAEYYKQQANDTSNDPQSILRNATLRAIAP